MKEYFIKDERDTEKFGHALADRLRAGDVVALIGDLGTGKTTLTGYIAEGLGVKEMITSPTFTIVNEYRSGRLPLFHFDAYRLEGGEDVFQAGVEEYFYMNGVCVIEWADRIAEILPDDTKAIFIEYGKKEGERIYRCSFSIGELQQC